MTFPWRILFAPCLVCLGYFYLQHFCSAFDSNSALGSSSVNVFTPLGHSTATSTGGLPRLQLVLKKSNADAHIPSLALSACSTLLHSRCHDFTGCHPRLLTPRHVERISMSREVVGCVVLSASEIGARLTFSPSSEPIEGLR